MPVNKPILHIGNFLCLTRLREPQEGKRTSKEGCKEGGRQYPLEPRPARVSAGNTASPFLGTEAGPWLCFLGSPPLFEVPGLLDAARGRKGAVLPCVRAAGAGQLQWPNSEEWALPDSFQAGVPRSIPALAWRVALGASDAGLEECTDCCITTDAERDPGIDDERGWRGRFSASICKLPGAAV